LFERFTERARQAVVQGQEEAGALRHDHVGTEHLLLGILRERDAVGAQVLESFGITLERARGEVVRVVGVGKHSGAGQISFTVQAREVLERSVVEANSLDDTYVGTEHILLGLLALGDGPSVRILRDCHAEPDAVRAQLLRRVSRPSPQAIGTAPNEPPPSDNGFEEWIRVGPGAGLRRLLMVAAARALDESREDIQPRDVLLALTRDEHTGRALADLGVDDAAIRAALARQRDTPPSTSAGG
jgi:ATP-dependent Clp protease ATP-binding subunit ClpC